LLANRAQSFEKGVAKGKEKKGKVAISEGTSEYYEGREKKKASEIKGKKIEK